MNITKQALVRLLEDAKKAHADYEKQLGKEDENWASWYAEFMLKQLQPDAVPQPPNHDENPNILQVPNKITKPIPESGAMSSPRNPSDESRSDKNSSPNAAYICPTCGHRNRPGTLVCENCGTMLTTGVQPVGTRDLRDEEMGAGDQPESRKGTAKLPDINAPSGAAGTLDADDVKAVLSAGTAVFEDNMVLRIEIEGGTTPILLHPKQQKDMILGRRDPTTGAMPDVDLTPYAGYRMGVSRRHSAMRLQEKQLDVWDLGSSNGTFLNGTRLNPHRPYRVKDGDEVRLGQMVLRVFFQADTSR